MGEAQAADLGLATRTFPHRLRRASAGLYSTITSPVEAGRFTLPPLGLVVFAAIGGLLLVVVATTRWGEFTDEYSYWIGAHRLLVGEPLYDPLATSVTPYAYRYAPVFAQALTPLVAIVPPQAFTIIWTAAMAFALYWLAGRRTVAALALIAFLPVAVELWYRNVHLLLAVLIALAITRWPVAFVAAGAIKLSPAVGLAYLASARRWRDAAIVAGVGLAVLAVSVALAPGEWSNFIATLRARGPEDVSAIVPVPYWIRVMVAIALALLAGRLEPRFGEPLLVVAIVVGLPTLWMTGLSTLVAIVPVILWRRAKRRSAVPTTQAVPATDGVQLGP